MEDLNIPENVRQKIDEMITEASKGMVFHPQLRHFLTQICFEMYKAGWKDAHRTMTVAVEMSQFIFGGGLNNRQKQS